MPTPVYNKFTCTFVRDVCNSCKTNAPQLRSCNCFVGPLPPFIISPYDHPLPSHSQLFAYKNFGCWAMANKCTYIFKC